MRDRTLWEAVCEFVSDEGSAGRKRIGERFRHDSGEHVAAVLSDLVGSGLLYASGRGRDAFYRAVTAAERREAEREAGSEGLAALVWLAVYRRRATSMTGLRGALNTGDAQLRQAVEQLVADGRLERAGSGDDAELSTQRRYRSVPRAAGKPLCSTTFARSPLRSGPRYSAVRAPRRAT